MNGRILVVEDEKAIAIGLKDNLVHEGFEVEICHNGAKALDRLRGSPFDLVLLDVMMPRMTGFELLELMHREHLFVPVVFLTARVSDEDKLAGLGLGADDYITKPFNVLVLIARVKAVLRRVKPGADLTNLVLGDREVDFRRQEVRGPNKKWLIGRYECNVLRLLASEPGRVFSRDEILNEVWGMEAFPSNRTVDNYIVKLRQKIEPSLKEPRYIHSIYGTGYKLVIDP